MFCLPLIVDWLKSTPNRSDAEMVGVNVDAIGALATAVVGVMTGIGELVGLLLSSLGYAGSKLSEQPNPGESRVSATRLVVAFFPLIGIAALLVGLWVFLFLLPEIKRARIEETEVLVAAIADEIVAEKEGNGKVVWPPRLEVARRDVWSQEMTFERSEGMVFEIVSVTSSGPDGEVSTPDDISARRYVVLRKREIGKNLLLMAKDAITGDER